MNYLKVKLLVQHGALIILGVSAISFLVALILNWPKPGGTYDFQGAANVATIIPSFAAVVIAAIALYSYIKVEDENYKVAVIAKLKVGETLLLIGHVLSCIGQAPSLAAALKNKQNLPQEQAFQIAREFFLHAAEKSILKIHENVIETQWLLTASFVDSKELNDFYSNFNTMNNAFLRGKLVKGLAFQPVLSELFVSCDALRTVILKMSKFSADEIYQLATRDEVKDVSGDIHQKAKMVSDEIRKSLGVG